MKFHGQLNLSLLFLLTALRVTHCQDEEPTDDDDMVTVSLRQGDISGKKEALDDGGDDQEGDAEEEEEEEDRFYYSFRGIPFALPPIEGLRFRDPLPPMGWDGTRDGSVAPPVCPQLDTDALQEGEIEVKGEEDCLYLNVYTPEPSSDALLPVMVWIHGGALISGGAEEYAPLALLEKDIVLVSIQYRLGALGFLSTADPILPGNLGLKDQTMALRWVKDNIQFFGGDPRRITLIGQGSGAASAHFQTLTPHAAGLFHRAILQSGSALSPWALRDDHRRVAYEVGQIHNCSDTTEISRTLDSVSFLYCLQRLSLEDLVVLPSYFTVWQNSPVVMVPRVDGSYLPDRPSVLLKTGRYTPVDIIAGYNQHEGALAALPLLLDEDLVDNLYENFDSVGPVLLTTGNYSHSQWVAQNIFRRYLGNEKISDESAEALVQMLSDANFKVTQNEVAVAHSARANVFVYQLQHRGQNSMTNLFSSDVGKDWVSHADDLQYLLLDNPYFPPLENSADLRIKDLLITMWTNFAAIGYPTPNPSMGFLWLPASPTCLRYLALTTSPHTISYGEGPVMTFWRSLPLQRNRDLHPERFSFWLPQGLIPPPVSTCVDQSVGLNWNSSPYFHRYQRNLHPRFFNFQKKSTKVINL